MALAVAEGTADAKPEVTGYEQEADQMLKNSDEDI